MSALTFVIDVIMYPDVVVLAAAALEKRFLFLNTLLLLQLYEHSGSSTGTRQYSRGTLKIRGVEEIVAVRTFRSRLPVRRVRHMDIQLFNYSIIESLSASRHRR